MLDAQKKNTIIIGVSGGADSICLLDLFLKIKKKFDLKIIVAHLNHGLRGAEADRDELFVKNISSILTTLIVLKFFKSKLIRDEHPLNISSI